MVDQKRGDAPDADCDELVRNAPGLHTEKSRSWGLISAGIVNRDAGEVTWRSNHHRVTVSLAVVQGTARIEDGPVRAGGFLVHAGRRFNQGDATRGSIGANRSEPRHLLRHHFRDRARRQYPT